MKQISTDTIKQVSASGAGYFAIDGVPEVGNITIDLILKVLVILPAVIAPLQRVFKGIRSIFHKTK